MPIKILHSLPKKAPSAEDLRSLRTRARRVRDVLTEGGRIREQRGQVFVLAAVAMVAMCGMAGFAIDVGSWYRAHRAQQAIADSAALAAAATLPGATGQATTAAQSYAAKNGGGTPSVTFQTQNLSNDTITVTASATAPTYFLKVLGISSTTVTATAFARAENLGTARGAMPFGVNSSHPQLAGSGCPCFGVATTLTVGQTGPGGFGLVNIDGSSGPQSPSTIAGWIQYGCSCSTAAPVWLYGSPGARFNSSSVQNAMTTTIGKTLLFPVYNQVQGNGANLQYHVIGWAGFTITSYNLRGSSGTISGSFTKVDWPGVGTSNTATYYGATTSRLVAR